MITIFNADCIASVNIQPSKNIHYLMLWILAVMTFSCNKNLEIEIEPAQAPYLEVDPTEFTFGPTETTTKMAMISTNAESWTFSQEESSKSWLTVEKRDNMLHMKPKDANTSTTERSANITVSADALDPVTVTVKQAAGGPPPVIFNEAKGKFFGDLSKNGNAQFHFYMYHTDDPRISVRIEGFCKMPPSFEQFKLDDGDYTCATSGAVRTFLPGSVVGLVLSPSIYYDESISKLILANGGTFNVSLSGDTYTITTNMTGTDYPSGDAANIPRTAFTGKIPWERYSLKVEPSSINFADDEVGKQTATVITESPTWEIDPVSATWVTAQKQGNQISFTTNSENTSESERETTVTVRANSAIPVEVKVTQKGKVPSPCTTYNTAVCDYWGNVYGIGTANFDLWMYNSSNSDIGLKIEGFGSLPASFANFRLETGTYTIASTGAVKTFYPGKVEGTTVSRTYLFNRNTHTYTLITDGTFTVSLSGSTYTITTSFTGKNVNTNAVVNNICTIFTGQLSYVDKVELPIPRSTYAASGTPGWLNTPGPSTWNGNFIPNNAEKYWEITNFTNNANITLKARYKDGKIILDVKDKVWENSTEEAYIDFLVKHDGGLHVLTLTEWPVIYNASNRTIDFSGTVNVNFGGSIGTVNDLALHVGVSVFNKSTGLRVRLLTDAYPNIKLVLTSSSSSSAVRQSNDLVEGNKIKDIMLSKSAGSRNTNIVTGVMKTIEIDKRF